MENQINLNNKNKHNAARLKSMKVVSSGRSGIFHCTPNEELEIPDFKGATTAGWTCKPFILIEGANCRFLMGLKELGDDYEISILNKLEDPDMFDGPDGPEKCTICCDVMIKGQELIILNCSHMYHLLCIVPWLQSNVTCPICREFT